MPQVNKSVANSVARRLSMTPVLVNPEYNVDTDMLRFLSMTAEERQHEQAMHENWCEDIQAAYGGSTLAERKPFAYANGVAVIPIHGMLVNKFGNSWGWVTGYQYVQKMTMAAAADPDVQLIVYDVDSGGGEVSGCAETASVIAGAGKPTMAIIDSASYSAAYWLTSQTDKVVSSQSGGAGSIGAMTMHIDVTKALEDDGVKVTLMYSGKHKVDRSQFKELSAEVKKKTEDRLDTIRNDFAETVAQKRGITVESALSTEADIFTAQEALDLKLIDAIGEPSAEILKAMSRLADGFDPFDDEDDEEDDEELAMSTTAKQTNKPVNTNAETEKPVDAAAVAAATRTRIKAINTHAQASVAPQLAEFLAYETDLDEALCCEILAKLPAAVAPEPQKPAAETNPETNGTKAENQGQKSFAKAMEETPNPEIKPNTTDKAEKSQLDSVLALIPGEFKID